MKILFLIPSGEQRSQARFRVLPFVKHGKRLGLDIDCREIPQGFYQRYTFFSRLPHVDVLVVHRELLSFFGLSILRNMANTLVYDIGDASWTKPARELKPFWSGITASTLARRFERFCRTADRCLVDNRAQADRMREHKKQLHILPTPVDVERYTPGTGGKEGGTVLVGWMGDLGDEPLLGDVMDRLAPHGGDIQFSIVSPTPYEGAGQKYVLWSTPSWESEPVQLQAMDIGLVPMVDDYYTRSGSNMEVLRFMASGVPVVASDVGRNAEVIDHGVDGYLVRDPEDWSRYVMRLAEDPELRQRMAEAARSKVVEKYGLDKTAMLLWQILKVYKPY